MVFDPRTVTQLLFISPEPGKGKIPIPVTFLGKGKYKYSYLMNYGSEDQTVISIIQIDPSNYDSILRRNNGNYNEGARMPSSISPESYAKTLTPETIKPFIQFMMDEILMLSALKQYYDVPIVEIRNSMLVSQNFRNLVNDRPLFFRCLENPDLVVAGYLTKYYSKKDGWVPFKEETNEKHESYKRVKIIDFQGFRNEKTKEEVVGDPFGIKGQSPAQAKERSKL